MLEQHLTISFSDTSTQRQTQPTSYEKKIYASRRNQNNRDAASCFVQLEPTLATFSTIISWKLAWWTQQPPKTNSLSAGQWPELHFQRQLLSNANSFSPILCLCIHVFIIGTGLDRAQDHDCVQPLVLWVISGRVEWSRFATVWYCCDVRAYMSFPLIHFHLSNNKIWKGRRGESIMCF